MVPFHVLLLVLYIRNSVVCHAQLEESVYWEIKNQTGILDGQSLRLRRLIHPTNTFHSCYEVSCKGVACSGSRNNDTVLQVCYPAVVTSGLSKCGTSAMHDLLTKFPNTITMAEKENCPFKRHPILWNYFQSLPRLSDIGDNIIIDGCINYTYNIKIRELLRNPRTYYVVMVRDYTDMLWSAYNFWCKAILDGPSCDPVTSWADPKLHKRSPEHFHNLVESKKDHFEGVAPWYPMHQPCERGRSYFRSVYSRLQSNRQHNHTIIVANEELDSYPLQVAQRVARFIGYNINGTDLSKFGNVRVNTQERKGAGSIVTSDKHLPGRYKISHYQPVLPKTRALINKCWYEDCIALSKIPPYYKYTACHPERVGDLTIADVAQHDKRLLDL